MVIMGRSAGGQMLFALLVVYLAFLSSAPAAVVGQPDEDVIEVFVIPHTHDDVGWLLSVDQYFTRNVRFILDSTIQQLLDNPERKFTYVEVAFFQRWWNQLPQFRREQLLNLHRRGQLEFNLGGMAMNDEGVTTYFEEINQMTHGASFLKTEIGTHAASAWHIDPFGHSAATAALWSRIGFDAFVLNRIPSALKGLWRDQKHLEFVWRPHQDSDEDQIWIHVLDSHYSSPPECAFNVDNGMGGIYIQDDPRLFDENVDKMVDDFVRMAKDRSKFYRHKKLLIPFGDDFAHREAYTSFVQMDKLIKYVNQKTATTGVKAHYAFLSEYVKAVNSLNITWPVFKGDFFPYQDGWRNAAAWSGYFTSRIALKGYVRSSDSLLHAGELFFTLFKDSVLKTEEAKIKANSQLEVLRQATSIATHHDAVTGTEKNYVAQDYTIRLNMGNTAVNTLFKNIFISLDNPKNQGASSDVVAGIAINLFNPLGWARKEVIRVAINSSNVVVVDSNGKSVPSQVNPMPSYSLDKRSALYNLFVAVELEPLQVQRLYVRPAQPNGNTAHLGVRAEIGFIENEYLRLYLNPTTNRMASVTNKKTGTSSQVEQNFIQYLPANGEEVQPSGAYIFQPTSNTIFVGGHSDKALHVVTRNFPREYNTPPIVLSMIRGQESNDTFAVSVRSVTTKRVTFNLYRADENQGWDQDVQLDYLVVDKNRQQHGSLVRNLPINTQYGEATVGPSRSPLATATIKFNSPFQGTPLVFFTAHSQDHDDTFVVNAQTVTNTYAVISIQRVDGNEWSQNLQVSWLAFVPSTPPGVSAPSLSDVYPVYPKHVAGKTIVSPSSLPLANVVINHPKFWNWPLVLVTIKGSGNFTWATTVRPITNQSSFQLTLRAVSSNGLKENLEVNWLLLKREDMVEYILPPTQQINTIAYTGPLVQELQQSFKEGYAQTVRLYKGMNDELAGNFIEIQEEIGPIDAQTEFVTRFSTDLNNEQTVFTDDNAMLIQKRVFNADDDNPAPANYFPMVSRAFIQDKAKNLQFTLISDRSHGAASLDAGQVEVMLDRRCSADDRRGVGEVLDERNKTQQLFLATYDGIENSAQLQRKLAIRRQFPIQVISYPSTGLSPTSVPLYGGLNSELPYNIHLLSMYTQDYFNFSQFSASPSNSAATAKSSQVLVRLQHIFEAGESTKYSTPVNIDLESLFDLPGWKVANITEVNLTADRAISEIKKLQWLTHGLQKNSLMERNNQQPNVVAIQPAEIRSFMFNLVAA